MTSAMQERPSIVTKTFLVPSCCKAITVVCRFATSWLRRGSEDTQLGGLFLLFVSGRLSEAFHQASVFS
jgi:hypothetical protein